MITFREFLTYIPFMRRFAPLPDYKRAIRMALAIDALALVILYVLLAPSIAMPLYNLILFHPMSENEDLSEHINGIESYFHCKFRDVSFKAPDGEKLHGWFFERPGAKKMILVSHGNAGCIVHRLPLLPLLLQTGCSVFMFDYEGFGSSTGSPTTSKMCDDTVAAFDFATQKLEFKPENIIGYGESIGCGATSVLSTKRKLGAIILQSPFTSLPEAAADKLAFMRLYPAFAFPEPTLNNLAIMKNEHAPLLLIHGKKDDLLPCRYSERIMAEAREPKAIVLLPNAGHNDVYGVDLDVSMKALNKFIADPAQAFCK